jgi:hypothetical protein
MGEGDEIDLTGDFDIYLVQWAVSFSVSIIELVVGPAGEECIMVISKQTR